MKEGVPYYLRKECQYQEDNPFTGTDRFSPVANGTDLPDSRDPLYINHDIFEFDSKEVLNCVIDTAWWHKQRQRCLYGYTVKNARKDGSSVTITGRHYFYLNFWWIYGIDKKSKSKAKTEVRPRFTDLDYEEFWIIESMFEEQKDCSFIKARQKGFSEKMAGGVMGYNYTFIPHSQNIIISGNEDDTEKTMTNVKRGLDRLINTQFYKFRSRNALLHIKGLNFGGEVIGLTAGSQGMQSVSRFSPFCIMYEEVGKWPKGLVTATREFVDASLWAEGIKTGYAFYIGTGGSMDQGAADLENMYYNPAEYGLLEFKDINEPEHRRSQDSVAHFIPSWKYAIIDDNGNSLREESILYHENNLKNRKGAKKFLYRVNHPRYASEAFLIPDGGYFGKDIVEACNERRDVLSKNSAMREKAKYGNTYWRDPRDWSKGVYFKEGPDQRGKKNVLIIEEPLLDKTTGLPYMNLYKQATDSYDRDEANSSVSLGSTIILFGFLDSNHASNYEVARLTVRPETFDGGAQGFYEEVLKLNILYGSINLIEYSNLRIFDFYDKYRFSSMLKERPSLAIAKMIQNSNVNNRYGIDPATKPHWISMLSDFLRKGDFDFINNCFDIDLLRAIAKFRYNPGHSRYNCDITISLALCVVLLDDEEELEVVSNQEERYKEDKFVFRRIGNRIDIL